MSKQTAKLILKRAGLDVFSLRELSDLMRDRFNPLPADVRMAITTLKQQG